MQHMVQITDLGNYIFAGRNYVTSLLPLSPQTKIFSPKFCTLGSKFFYMLKFDEGSNYPIHAPPACQCHLLYFPASKDLEPNSFPHQKH